MDKQTGSVDTKQKIDFKISDLPKVLLHKYACDFKFLLVNSRTRAHPEKQDTQSLQIFKYLLQGYYFRMYLTDLRQQFFKLVIF